MSLDPDQNQTDRNTPFATPSTSPNPSFVTGREDSRHRRSRTSDPGAQSDQPQVSRRHHRSADGADQPQIGANINFPLLQDAIVPLPPSPEEEVENILVAANSSTEESDQSEDEEVFIDQTIRRNSPRQQTPTTVMSEEQRRLIERLSKRFKYHHSDDEDEEITDNTSPDEKVRILRGRKARAKEAEWQRAIQALAIHHKEKDKPTFNGTKDKKPESHILMVEDWRDKQDIDELEIVTKFKETLEGQARIWYDELDIDEDMDWEKLQQEFIREYSKGGKSDFQIKLEQHTLRFDPNKDKIKDFIRDYKTTAKILKWDDEELKQGLCETLPQETYYIASALPTLKALVKFMIDTYSRKRNHTATVSDATMSPFMSVQQEVSREEDSSPAPPKDKPYKPWITPSRPGRPSYGNMQRQSSYDRRDSYDRNRDYDRRYSGNRDHDRSYSRERNYNRNRSYDRDRGYDRNRSSSNYRNNFRPRNWRQNNWRNRSYRPNYGRRNNFQNNRFRGRDQRRNNRDNFRSFRNSYRSQSRDSRQSRSYSRDRYRSLSNDRYDPNTTKRFISPKPRQQSYRQTDTARQKSIDETRCYRCNEPGHFAKECPLNDRRNSNSSRRNSYDDRNRSQKNVSFRYGETKWNLDYEDVSDTSDGEQEN